MIHKVSDSSMVLAGFLIKVGQFWSVKLAIRRAEDTGDGSGPVYVYEEQQETAETLKEKQIKMEKQVYRIWTLVLDYPLAVSLLMLHLVSYLHLKSQVRRVSPICFGT
jgi:hypothetical protein